jgi:hypothetical protein
MTQYISIEIASKTIDHVRKNLALLQHVPRTVPAVARGTDCTSSLVGLGIPPMATHPKLHFVTRQQSLIPLLELLCRAGSMSAGHAAHNSLIPEGCLFPSPGEIPSKGLAWIARFVKFACNLMDLPHSRS